MLEQPELADRWIAREHKYGPMRRGGRPAYAQVYAEAPARMEIRAAIANGHAYTTDLPAKRVRLIVAQEIARSRGETAGFSCECDAAKGADFDGDAGALVGAEPDVAAGESGGLSPASALSYPSDHDP